jgi:SAM-dependent methyltransferase
LELIQRLPAQARLLDPTGDYKLARAENLPFDAASFDLVVSYLTLIDIPDFRAALREMVRVLKPGGSLLICEPQQLHLLQCRGMDQGSGGALPTLSRRSVLGGVPPSGVEWSGIRIHNWHRPLAAYMKELLGHGLVLTFFDEPQPRSGNAEQQARHRRVPWFLVMEWRRPISDDRVGS